MFLLFEEYEIIFESNKELDLEFDKLDENIKGIIDNPVKYTKIKNNAKKLQQALIQKDTADLQYQKKIKGKEIPAEKKEIMKAATAAKKKALDDQISAINGRMDDLGSTEALQLVVRLAKSKAKINATEKILKTATEAESAQLKSKVDKLKQQVQKDEAKAKELGNKSKEKAKEEPKKEEPKEEPKKDDTSKEAQIEKDIKTINTVSYTHLTLPTNREV